MTTNKKVRAFTISEMLVVLVLSSLLIGITLVVLNLVQSQLRSIEKISENNSKIQLLERALWQDFNSYTVAYDAQTNSLQCRSEIDSVKYQISKDYIVRQTDTVFIAIDKIQCYLDGEVIASGIIDAIAIDFSQNTVRKKRFIFKRNDATLYMQ